MEARSVARALVEYARDRVWSATASPKHVSKVLGGPTRFILRATSESYTGAGKSFLMYSIHQPATLLYTFALAVHVAGQTCQQGITFTGLVV